MHKFTKLILILVIGLWSVVLSQEFLLKFFIPGTNFIAADVLDFLVIGFFVTMFFLIYKSLEIKETSKGWLVSLFFFLMIFVDGHGVHFATNSIHNLADTEGLNSGEIFNLINFYDEILGHILINVGLFGLFLSVLVLHLKNPLSKLSKKEEIILLLVGAGAGVLHGFSLLEGQLGFVSFIFLPVLIFTAYLLTRNEDRTKLPFLKFAMTSFVGAFLVIMTWFGFTDSFKEPSKAGVLKPSQTLEK